MSQCTGHLPNSSAGICRANQNITVAIEVLSLPKKISCHMSQCYATDDPSVLIYVFCLLSTCSCLASLQALAVPVTVVLRQRNAG